MTVAAASDAPHVADRPGFSDSLTYAFADADAGFFGVARLGVADGAASGLVVLFAGGEPAAVRAEGGGQADGGGWDALDVAGLTSETLAPLESWRLRSAGAPGFELAFEALAPPAELSPEADAARAGGMQGFDHLCRVTGTVGGAPFSGLGQRGRSWGAPDWERMSLARTLTAWLDEGHAVTAVAVRPATASSHAEEALAAFVFDAERADDPVRPVSDPRLSTAYDAEGRQRRAGLELYVGEEDAYPLRAAGSVVAGTSLDLGRLRLDCAFLHWHMEGREGIGRYDVLRRVA